MNTFSKTRKMSKNKYKWLILNSNCSIICSISQNSNCLFKYDLNLLKNKTKNKKIIHEKQKN